jgi:hypothetical protein
MDKSLMIFITIGIGFLYFITNFVGDIQAEDDKYKNNDYNQEHKYDKYNTVDSIGQGILDLTGADEKTQIDAWNSSFLKQEFVTLFPNFDEMRSFVKDRIRGEILQNKLEKSIKKMEDGFFSGTISAEQAKRELNLLK